MYVVHAAVPYYNMLGSITDGSTARDSLEYVHAQHGQRIDRWESTLFTARRLLYFVHDAAYMYIRS